MIDLESFTQGFLVALLWSSEEDGENWGLDELDPATLERLESDCAKFCADHAELIRRAWEEFRQSAETCGHDFALTRNHHGAGFWDGDYGKGQGGGELGQALTRAAHSFPQVDLYRGDDGRVYA